MWFTLILSALKPLKVYWKELAVIGMIAILAYQNFAETRFMFFLETIPSLERRLDIAQSNFNTCKKGNDTLANNIKKRNDEIGKWKEVSNGLQEKNDTLAIIIADNQKKTSTAVNEILEAPTPPTCKAAIEFLRESTEELTW